MKASYLWIKTEFHSLLFLKKKSMDMNFALFNANANPGFICLFFVFSP